MRSAFRFGLVLTMGLAAAPALAGSHDFVIQHAGAGGNSQSAAPYIDEFLRYAESVLKWQANSAKGEFSLDQAAAVQYIEQTKPGFGILDPSVFLDLQKKYDLQPIASVQGDNQLSGHLSVVVKDGKLKSLTDLKGKTVVGNHLENAKFLTRIVFQDKLDAEKDLKLQPSASPLKGLKAVSRGEADATLVDDAQLANMKQLDPGLRAIYKSPSLPPTPVVAFGKNTTQAERDAFAKMQFSACSDSKGGGAKVCDDLKIKKFTPPDKAAYEDAVRRYSK